MPNRRKLFLYSSLFITLVINMPKLLALRKNGILAHFWHFDIWELCFRTIMLTLGSNDPGRYTHKFQSMTARTIPVITIYK